MSEVKPSREALTRREESFPPLLPLPANPFGGGVSADELREWCRANMEPLLAENERLRGEAARLRRSLNEAIIHGNRQSGRAERLAKALRELVEVFSESGMYDEEVFAKARAVLDQEDGK